MPNHKMIADMPLLTQEQIDDATFRVRDSLWGHVGDLFDKRREEQGLTFAQLARRIGRTRSQVHRWLTGSHNMTLQSAGLIAEGLDSDVVISFVPRELVEEHRNYMHPCEDAQVFVVASKQVPPANTAPSVMASIGTSTTSEKTSVTGTWRKVEYAQ